MLSRAAFYLILALFFLGRIQAGRRATAKEDPILERHDRLRLTAEIQRVTKTALRIGEARSRPKASIEIPHATERAITQERLVAAHKAAKLICNGFAASTEIPQNPSIPRFNQAEDKPSNPSPGQDPVKKWPVPEATSLKEADKLIRDIFREEFTKVLPSDVKRLALKLMEQEHATQGDPKSIFALLREARDLAASIAEVDISFKAIARLDELFIIDAIGMKAQVLDVATRRAETPELSKAVLTAFFAVVDEAIGQEKFEVAKSILLKADAFAKTSKQLSQMILSKSRLAEIDRLQKVAMDLKAAERTLLEKPDDPGANLIVGKHLCFTKGDWKEGLSRLAMGSDANLKGIAQRELSKPDKTDTQVELGDMWFGLASKSPAPPEKRSMLERAQFWYEQAFPSLMGLSKLKVEKRLADIKREVSDLHPSVPAQGLVGQWFLDEGYGTSVIDSSGYGNKGTLNGGVEWVRGAAGSVLSFDGRTGYVTLGVNNMPAVNAPKTIAWAHQVGSNPVPDSVILALSSNAPVTAVTIGYHESGKIVVWSYGGTPILSCSPPTPKEWHNFAYTYDGNIHRLYADGKLANTSTSGVQTGACKQLELGRWWEGSIQYFSGYIEDVRIYSRPISEQEVQALIRHRK